MKASSIHFIFIALLLGINLCRAQQAITDKLDTFQVVLIDRSDIGIGDFDMEFNYAQVQWETGDASGGSDGLGGSSARVGYASVNGSAFEMTGSGVPGSFLDSNPTTGLIHNDFNSTVPGRYVFQFRNGVPLNLP